ncbi:DUF7697 family protein [Loktanella sp. M215]|uniref:DUF7697 family protein n=1 Tax=Loktanella sp. M215 TaxID=2675431 RepID=UPI001F3BDAE7|nr:hypothetical protein [Loktanella sp. M215]MCF7700553.1 hypothetical protein [Loktanella sp. M215]
MWDLVQSLQGQMRIVSGQTATGYVAFDMTAALALARAMGLPAALAADLLPRIETVAVAKMNEQLR